MADPKRLPEGQVNPGAKPVSAFINPGSINVARPTQFPSTPQPKGVRTVSTGGTTYVQGYNQAKQLADALAPFTKQAMATAQTVGLKYVSYKIEEGERKAWEAEAEATKALMKADESLEISQNTAAKNNRKLSDKDYQAALWAKELNPYTRIGIQRGRAKIAAHEVPLGMRAFVSESADKINFDDGANGLTSLQGIRAQYVNSVFEKHGLKKNGPGVDKYLMPVIEKTSEKIANDIFSRSVKYNDEIKPGLLANKLKIAIKQINGTGGFTFKGVDYNREVLGETEYTNKAKEFIAAIIREDVADAMMKNGGQVRMQEAYKILSEDQEFIKNGNLDLLDSVDSVQTIEFDGQKYTLKIGEAYGSAPITDNLAEKALKRNTAIAKTAAEDFENVLNKGLNNLQEGETVEAGVQRIFNEYIESLGGEENIHPTTMNKLREVLAGNQRSAGEGGLIIEGLMPQRRLDLNKKINDLTGKDFLESYPDMKKEIYTLAEGMNAADSDKYIRSTLKLLNDKRDQLADLDGYSDTIEKLKTDRKNSYLQQAYGAVTGKNSLDFSRSNELLDVRFSEVIADALLAKIVEKGGKLTPWEAQRVGSDAITKYINENATEFSGMFPGAKQERLDKMNLGLTSTESVNPSNRQEIVIPEGEKEGKKVIRLYEVDQLDSFPNRGSVLRRYRDRPILPLEALREQISNIINGGEIPLSLKKARVEAQAPDLFDFLMKQVDQYPNYDLQKDFSLDDLEKLKTELVSMGSAENSLVATHLLEDTHPNLASRNEWLDPFKEVQTAGMRLSGDRYLHNWEMKMLIDTYKRDKDAGRSIRHYHKFYPELFG